MPELIHILEYDKDERMEVLSRCTYQYAWELLISSGKADDPRATQIIEQAINSFKQSIETM